MGRVKLRIKKLENTSGRQITYSKRRAGILKKAKELSVLCDIDVLLLMFSPTGKPTLCIGENSDIEEVIAKFAQLTPQERAKRKVMILEALKKTFKKLDHDINISDFLGSGSQTVEELANCSLNMQSQISEMERKLSYWTDPEKVNSLEQITQMEDNLRESINRIQMQKKCLESQLMPLNCSAEFHNDLHVPMALTTNQQQSYMQWLHAGDDQHFMLPGGSSLLPERNHLCSAETLFEGYHGYFGTERRAMSSEQAQEESLKDMAHNSYLQLQLGEQYPYNPYELNYLNVNKFNPNGEAGFQEFPLSFQVNDFEPPHPGFNTGLQAWASNSGSCGGTMLDSHPYFQHPK